LLVGLPPHPVQGVWRRRPRVAPRRHWGGLRGGALLLQAKVAIHIDVWLHPQPRVLSVPDAWGGFVPPGSGGVAKTTAEVFLNPNFFFITLKPRVE